MLHALNAALSERQLSTEKLNTLFDAIWTDLEKTLSAIPEALDATPPSRSPEDMLAELLDLIRGLNSNAEIAAQRIDIQLKVIAAKISAPIVSARTVSSPEKNVIEEVFKAASLVGIDHGTAMRIIELYPDAKSGVFALIEEINKRAKPFHPTKL